MERRPKTGDSWKDTQVLLLITFLIGAENVMQVMEGLMTDRW